MAEVACETVKRDSPYSSHSVWLVRIVSTFKGYPELSPDDARELGEELIAAAEIAEARETLARHELDQ